MQRNSKKRLFKGHVTLLSILKVFFFVVLGASKLSPTMGRRETERKCSQAGLLPAMPNRVLDSVS